MGILALNWPSPQPATDIGWLSAHAFSKHILQYRKKVIPFESILRELQVKKCKNENPKMQPPTKG